MKKGIIFLYCIILLSTLVLAQTNKMEMSIISEDKIFEPGQTIELKVSLYDSNNNLINDEVSIILENVREETIKEITINSNNIEEIELPEETLKGEGKIIAKYKDWEEVTEPFFVSGNELVEFEILGDKLIITNVGNMIYDNTIYITIGETTEQKTSKLNIGESISYRLIAPDGTYNIRITDRKKTVSINDVALTGKVVEVLDETTSGGSGLTGGVKPEDNDDLSYQYLRKSKFVYVFVLVIFGAMILLAIERRYRKKAE